MGATDPTLRFLESTVDFAVIHTTPKGVITHWCGAAPRTLGYSANEAVGMSLSVLFTPEDIARGLDVQEITVAATQGRSEDDRWHLRKDGGRFWASGVLTALHDDAGAVTGLCKVLRDKTDVKTRTMALENEVRALRFRLETEQKAIGLLAHELRNPLMPIVTALALLQRPDAAHLAQRATQTLVGQVDLLKRLIDDLDAVGSDLSAQPVLQLQPVDLNAALTELVETHHGSILATERRVSLIVPREAIWINADPARLQQILMNLMNNAVKYTAKNGRVDINATVEDAMAVVRIEDDGIGIAPAMLPRIFDLFIREGRSPEVDGKGVGLSIVKQLAVAHGGVIDVRSPGFDFGSTFSLRIPVCAAPN